MDSTVILGSGIIGVATAYYLSEHQAPSSIHLVEPSPELFASASGYAGGFLAKDWFAPQLASLGELSYAEHKRLAEQHDGRAKWGYSVSATYGHSASQAPMGANKEGDWLSTGESRSQDSKAVGLRGEGPEWLRRVEGDDVQLLSGDDTTGQVDPLQLCQFLLQECLSRGVRLHHPAQALSIRTDAVHDELSSVRIAETDSSAETDLPCTRLLIAAGAWSSRVFNSLFPHSTTKIPISSLSGHSLVFKSPFTDSKERPCCAVCSTAGDRWSPELYSRLGGTIYITGVNSATEPLPELPTNAAISEQKVAELKKTAQRMICRGSDANEEVPLEVIRQGHCFRPVSETGFPMLGRIGDEQLGPGVATRKGSEGGVFLAAGHGPWGISLGLGTGKIMAEMMQGRGVSADVDGLMYEEATASAY